MLLGSEKKMIMNLPDHYSRRKGEAKELPNSMEQLHRNWNTGFGTGRRKCHVRCKKNNIQPMGNTDS